MILKIGDKAPRFCITRKKRAIKVRYAYEILVIDGTETPIEKSKKATFR